MAKREEKGETGMLGLRPTQLLMLGGMLFSMFFGAGNLILPPLLGAQAGSDTAFAMIGFLVAAIGLPVLGIVAVALVGDVRQLAGRVSRRFAAIFIALVYLTIGPFLAIPRTSSTAFEMLKPIIPGEEGLLLTVAFSVAFFGVAFALALHPGALSRILGRFSAPALILLIAVVVIAALAGGAGDPSPARAPYERNALAGGFLVGYQTMDLLAALCFGIVVAMNVRDQGVTEPAKVTGAISAAGIVAGALMAVVYCGLAFVGVSMSAEMGGAGNGAAVIAASAAAHFGEAGSLIVAAIFLLACLNVCTGLISCCSEYFSETFPRIPHPVWAGAFALFSCAVSLLGLDAIIAFSAPLLGALYPPAIVMVLMGLFHGACDHLPRMWPWAVALTAVASVAAALRDAFAPAAWLPIDALAGADLGLGWVTFAVAGLVVGAIHSLVERRAKAARP